MQKRVVLVSAAAVLGLAAIVLGFVASKKSKGFLISEDFDGQQHCVYRRNPGLGCGVAAALLALTGVTLATTAACCADGGRATGGRREVADRQCQIAWLAMLTATVMFLYAAAMKRGLWRPDWHDRANDYGCTELRSSFFTLASILCAVATGYAIAAYVSYQRTETDEDEDEPASGVEMGQPEWA